MKFKLKQIFCLLIISQLIFFAVKAEQIRVYVIPLYYDKGVLSFGEIITKSGYLPPPNDDLTADKNKRYLIELIAFNKQKLESQYFSFNLIILLPPPLPGQAAGSPATLDKASTLVIFPYHKDGQTLNVYDGQKKLILTKDIAYLADVCGDNVCQDHESYESCTKDCAATGKDDYCNIDRLNQDPDCGKLIAANLALAKSTQATTKSILAGKLIIYVIALILLLTVVAAYFIYRKRKNSSSTGFPPQSAGRNN